MPEPWEEYTATQEVSPWEEFGQTAVAEPPAPSDLFDAQLSAAPQRAAPGFFRMLGRQTVAPLAAAKKGLDLPLSTDDELKDYLERKFLESKGEKEPTTMGKVGGFIGGLLGTIGEAVVGSGAAMPGIAATFASQAGHDAFVNAGVKALAEGKSIDEALNIAKGIGPIGATVGAATTLAFPGKAATSFAQAGKQGLPLGAAGAASQLLENIAQRELGLKTPVFENVPTAGLTMFGLPIGQYGIRTGLRALRGRPVTEPTIPTERPADAISKRETAPVPVDEASRGRGAVVEEVRQPETPADVQAQQAKAVEQPAPAEGKSALGDVAVDPSTGKIPVSETQNFISRLGDILEDPKSDLSSERAFLLGDKFPADKLDELRQYRDQVSAYVASKVSERGKPPSFQERNRLARLTMFVNEVIQGSEKPADRPIIQETIDRAKAKEKVPETKPAAVTEPKPAEPGSAADLLRRAQERAAKVKTQAEPILPPEAAKAAIALPPVPEGHVRYYHGTSKSGEGGTTERYWAKDTEGKPLSGLAKALQYGEKIKWVDIPRDVEAKSAFGRRKGEITLDDPQWASRAKDLGEFEKPVYEPELAAAEPVKPTPEVPKPEPAKAAEPAPSTAEAGMKRLDELHRLQDYGKLTEEQSRELDVLESAARTKITEGAPEPMRVGPGAAVPADVQSTQSDMAQLASTMENVASPKKTATQRVAEAKQEVANLKTEVPRNIGEMARNGVERLSAIGSAIKTGLTKLPEFTQFKKIMGQWLGANQQADLELRQFVKTINKKIPQDRQVAITNYIQADGDAAVLRQRADASNTAKLKKGYEDALTLTRDEKIAADQIRIYLDNRLQEGIDSGILDHGLDNYITQIWKVPNPVTQKLISDISIGKLQPNFKFARQRLLESYFQGEQLGLVPANKAVSALIAAYDQSFNRSLAARAFIKNLTEGTASDGRPLVEVSGSGRLVGDEATTQAILVKSKTKPEEIADYRTIDHPALRKWKWATKTPEGTNVFVEGQLLVHPEIYSHLRNVLSRSAFRQYAFPRTVLRTERLIKELMFTASGFHQVQETLHALGHRVNPTNLETLDMSKPWLKEGVEHGLQIADYNALENFSEGLNTGPIISKIPLVGKRLLGPYTEWLFQDNIPRIKATMYKHAMERNLERFDSQLRSGKITRDQVSELTAKQANAAFGELNYKWMGRNPTFQDALRTFLIAPDFLEARGRFVGQALKPYGREQLVALGLLAATQYITARILNQIFDKNPHLEPENAFKLIVKKHSYELRSVPGDILHLLSKPHQFATARISPLIRQAIEGITGRDWRGVKRDAWEQVKDFARLPTPISIRQEDDQRWWETFLNALGVHERSYTAGQEIGDLARKYRESVKGKPIVEVLEDTDSPYRKLRVALDVGNERDSIAALRELRKTHKDKQIFDSMKSHLTAPFSGLSKADESKFRRSLSPVEMEKYREALAERRERFKKFQMIWSKRGPRTAP